MVIHEMKHKEAIIVRLQNHNLYQGSFYNGRSFVNTSEVIQMHSSTKVVHHMKSVIIHTIFIFLLLLLCQGVVILMAYTTHHHCVP